MPEHYPVPTDADLRAQRIAYRESLAGDLIDPEQWLDEEPDPVTSIEAELVLQHNLRAITIPVLNNAIDLLARVVEAFTATTRTDGDDQTPDHRGEPEGDPSP